MPDFHSGIPGRCTLLAARLAAPLLLLPGCFAPTEEEGLRFVDVTDAVGLGGFSHENGAFGEWLEPEILGAGAAFLDYDLDGWMDLMLVGGGSFRGAELLDVPAIWLFRNEEGTFRMVNDEVGLSGVRTFGMGLAVGDVDNDGDPDVLLTTVYEDLLFCNDEVGSRRIFVEVGRESGVGLRDEWSTSAIFFDADRDGWLDLYVATYLQWSAETDRKCSRGGWPGYCTPEESRGIADRFYRNNGDGTFTERTQEAGIAKAMPWRLSKTLGVAEHDFNEDGWPDLYVANDTERDLLLVNRGDGTFAEEGMPRAVALSPRGKARAGMGVDAGVVDESGKTSLFVGNFSGEAVGLYRYTDHGYFDERADHARLTIPTNPTLTFGLFLFDPDLDGDLDLFLANGHIQRRLDSLTTGATFRQPAQLFLNDGSGAFTEFGAGTAPFTDRMVGRGAAFADFDRDGDLDVLITENGGRVRLWRNEIKGPRSVRLILHGAAPSNQDAFGAEVTARAGSRVMKRRLHGGSSYVSQSEPVLTFGLGDGDALEEVVVVWPNGVQQALGRIEGGSELHVHENSIP